MKLYTAIALAAMTISSSNTYGYSDLYQEMTGEEPPTFYEASVELVQGVTWVVTTAYTSMVNTAWYFYDQLPPEIDSDDES